MFTTNTVPLKQLLCTFVSPSLIHGLTENIRSLSSGLSYAAFDTTAHIIILVTCFIVLVIITLSDICSYCVLGCSVLDPQLFIKCIHTSTWYVQLLAEHYNLHCKFWLLSQYRVCRLLSSSSVTRVYCDKTTKAMIMQFSLKSSKMPQIL